MRLSIFASKGAPSRLRARWLPLCAALAPLAFLCACSSGSRDETSKMMSYSTGGSEAQLFTVPQDQLTHLKVAAVESAAVRRVRRFSGAVAFNAFRTTPVISPVGGPVSRIVVVPGEHVAANQPLLYVASPDYALLRATYLKARDTFRVADKNFDRAQDLYEHHAIAERDLLQADSDRIQAKADLEASEQNLKILGITSPDELASRPSSPEIPLLAPLGGEIVERLVAPGQLLQAGATQAFTISDTGSVWVLANIYQNDLAAVHVGDTVTIETDAYPGEFHGRISFIAPALDPNTRTLQARIVTENPDGKLKRDMYVTVVVEAAQPQNAILVPDAAVLRDAENLPFVYVATSPNQFGRRRVEVGQSQHERTQILDGLKPGERVVGDGSLFLQFANSLK
jgi:cobalt-zinc-cadmium efflux system membrane fusion protein